LVTYAHSQPDQYGQAESLFKDKRYDEVIRLLSEPANAEPGNFKLNILLAKAQIEKCAILKAKGDKSYKTLIHQPYQKGRMLHKIDKTRPEPYYLVARSLLINNRPYKAEKAIKKALYFSPANAEYFVVLGDTYKAQAEMSRNSDGLLSKAKDTYEKAMKATEEKAEEFRSIVEEKVNEVSEKLK
jgi:tetratricopeptide (TPR) repeat protein